MTGDAPRSHLGNDASAATGPSTRKTNPIWFILLAMAAVAAIVGAFFVGSVTSKPLIDAGNVVGFETESSSTQVIQAVKRTEEIALASLGIQGIEERTEHATVFGIKVPGSDRALYMQYTFTAKLGIDGSKVDIIQAEDGTYEITIPEFVFIGHDDVEFKLIVEQNGVLSFATPVIDKLEMTNAILNDEAQQHYIDDNAALLQEQVESFYRGIVEAIDPDAEIRFAYADNF